MILNNYKKSQKVVKMSNVPFDGIVFKAFAASVGTFWALTFVVEYGPKVIYALVVLWFLFLIALHEDNNE